jgi:hypothetical protein
MQVMTDKDTIFEPEVELTKKGTVRKRKPKTKNFYFTEDTENAILEYRACINQAQRNRIYNEKIHYGFYKLCENIIHSFKFYYLDANSIEDLKYEVISFLIQKLDRYEKSQGKAYSYFGTIAKRYLIVYNQKNYKKTISKVEISDVDNDDHTIDKLVENEANKDLDPLDVVDEFIRYMELNLFDIFESDIDIKIADAVLELFRKREKLEIFNKKVIFIYIKEMVDVPTNSITKVIKQLKTIYKKLLEEHLLKMEG